jgi:hypothetical protein
MLLIMQILFDDGLVVIVPATGPMGFSVVGSGPAEDGGFFMGGKNP